MMNPKRSLISRLPWQHLLAFCLLIILVSAISSCRGKDSPTGPNQPPPAGAWVIYLSHDGVHIGSSNDTISVRVYNPDGVLSGNVSIHSVNVDSANLHVAGSVATITDTINFPWGTDSPLVYWGMDSTVEVDTIISTAFVAGIEVADTFTIMNLIGNF